MNEDLIESLAKQAVAYADSIHTEKYTVYMENYNTKFAELIANATCNIILHYTDVDEGVGVAKKHFGIE